MHLDSIEDFQFIDSHQSSRQSFQEFPRQEPPPNDGIRLIDEQGAPIRRRGRTTCTDIQCMPLGTRVHIEVNENGVPCNIPESILLGSYMGVVARDSVLAPISFSDWRNRGMEPFKKRILAEVESKFEFHANIRHWILQSIGVKWRNYKASLKSEHWDSRPIKEIKEVVPVGVDPTQWCQLVNQWAQPEDQKRAAKNVKNAKKQTCPHTMGRVSSVRRQQETSIQDRLQLWRINRMRKDGLWSSENAKLRWAHACKMLAEEGLTPEDGNLEANERVFKAVMGPEYPGRVRTQGFGVTPTRYFPQSTTHPGNNSSSSAFARVARLEKQLRTLQKEMRQVVQHCQGHYPPSRSSDMVGNDQLLPE